MVCVIITVCIICGFLIYNDKVYDDKSDRNFNKIFGSILIGAGNLIILYFINN